VNHYPRHVGDFIRDTVGLSLAERGAYTALLDTYYASERPIQHAERYRITGAISKSDKAAVDYVMGRYFSQGPDGWHQKRADREIEHYRERSASASASAQARWCKGNANAMRTHSEGNANHKPVTSNQKVKSVARKRATPLPEGFAISDSVRLWAVEKGHTRLEAHLEAFLSKVAAKGYTYLDWDAAFRNCIREDWGKVNSAKPVLSSVPLHASQQPAKLPELGPHTMMPDDAREALAKFMATKVRA
jgi:uncharacterized protein YdaU (DUF1376 family)